MRIREIRTRANAVVKSALEADILLAYVLGKPREFLLMHDEVEVAEKDAKTFFGLCEERAAGVPVAYLTHEREFFGLKFYVDQRVLIPRPETELLVEETLRLCKDYEADLPAPRIVDVGTGSGCVAIALAKNLPNAAITAVDISEDALAVAYKNAKTHGVTSQLTFRKNNLIVDLPPFDIIVANLPYISTSETALVSPETLHHEPHLALFGGATGYELFITLFSQIAALPKPPLALIGEMGFNQREGLERELAHFFPKARVVWKDDLAGLPRAFVLSF